MPPERSERVVARKGSITVLEESRAFRSAMPLSPEGPRVHTDDVERHYFLVSGGHRVEAEFLSQSKNRSLQIWPVEGEDTWVGALGVTDSGGRAEIFVFDSSAKLLRHRSVVLPQHPRSNARVRFESQQKIVVIEIEDEVVRYDLTKDQEVPNKALEPTPPSVTIRAGARLAPAGVVAHL